MSTKEVVKSSSISSGGSVRQAAQAYESSTRTASSTTTFSSSGYRTGGSTTISSGGTYITNGTSHMINGSVSYKEYGHLIKDRDVEITDVISLNDRLAKYIDTVRSYEISKEELESLVIKQMNEMIQVDVTREVGEYAKQEYYKLDSLVAGLNADISGYDEELRRLDTMIRERKSEISSNTTQIERLIKEREELAVLIAGLEARLVALRSEIEVFEKICKEISTRTDFDTRVKVVIERYQHKYDLLVHELDIIRKDFAARLIAYERDLQRKIHLEIVTGTKSALIQEFGSFKMRVFDLKAQIDALNIDKEKYALQLAIYAQEIVQMKSWRNEIVVIGRAGTSEAEIKSMIEGFLRYYEYLVEDNVMFKKEIEKYRMLLGEEEHRLHVHQHHHHLGHYYKTEKFYSQAGVLIDEVNMQGNYIQLTNKGHEEINLKSWKLSAKAMGEPHNKPKYVYEFPLGPNHRIKPGKSIKIWSSNSGGAASHNAPDSYVMPKDVWPTDNCILVELFDEHGEQKAFTIAFYPADKHKFSIYKTIM